MPLPTITVQQTSVSEGQAIQASTLIGSINNPSGDSLYYAFYDFGGGSGYLLVNGVAEFDDTWWYEPADKAYIQYVGGSSSGSDTIAVAVYDATIGQWTPYQLVTATTTASSESGAPAGSVPALFAFRFNGTPVVNVQNISVAENASIAASSMITSVTHQALDSITEYAFLDEGGGTGHLTLNGITQADGQWVVESTSSLSSIQYVGGPSPGSDKILVAAYDATTNMFTPYATVTATTISIPAPHAPPVVIAQDLLVAENATTPASTIVKSITNPSNDSITKYAFWDEGGGTGHLTLNGTTQPDGQWVIESTSSLGSIQYVGGSSPGGDTIAVSVFDATTGVWTNIQTVTATTTPPPHVPPTVNVQNISVAENAAISASALIGGITNPSNDTITEYAFFDEGGGTGHLTLNGITQADGQWVIESTSSLSSVQYVGGSSPGNEVIAVTAYDATTETWTVFQAPTATTKAPVTPTVNVQNISVAENATIQASTAITSIINPSGDNITYYAFWDEGGGSGHLTSNGITQADGQWVVESTSSLSSIQYKGGPSTGSDTIAVAVFDGTTGLYTPYVTFTAKTTTPTLALLGQYAAAGFATSADPGSGTLVTDTAQSNTPTLLTNPQH